MGINPLSGWRYNYHNPHVNQYTRERIFYKKTGKIEISDLACD